MTIFFQLQHGIAPVGYDVHVQVGTYTNHFTSNSKKKSSWIWIYVCLHVTQFLSIYLYFIHSVFFGHYKLCNGKKGKKETTIKFKRDRKFINAKNQNNNNNNERRKK